MMTGEEGVSDDFSMDGVERGFVDWLRSVEGVWVEGGDEGVEWSGR